MIQITVLSLEVRSLFKFGCEPSQVYAIDIRCDVAFAAMDEQLRQIANPSPYFHNLLSEVWPDCLCHPPIESWANRQSLQGLRAAILVHISRPRSFQHHEHGIECVFKANLLPLLVRSPVVTNSCFENPCLSL